MRFFLLSCLLIFFAFSFMPAQPSISQAQSGTPEPSVILEQDELVNALAWSSDGEALAIGTGDLLNLTDLGTISLYIPSTQRYQIVIESALPARDLTWRESDKAIFSTHDAGPYFYGWASTTGEQIAIAPESGQGFGLAFNPMDERLAVSYGWQLTLYDAALETPMKEATYHTKAGGWVETYVVLWMPDGECLITTGHPDAPDFISLWCPNEGHKLSFEESNNLTANKFDVHLALSSDGKHLAAATGAFNPWYEPPNQDVFIWSTKDGALQQRFTTDTNGSIALAWSPDGQVLAIAGRDATLTFWNRTTETKTEWAEASSSLAWSSANQLAIGRFGEVLIFDMNEIELE